MPSAGVHVALRTFNGYVKSDLTVAAYRGHDGTTPIAASASKTDNVTGATHVSPAVTATDDTSWLVTYWADKSDSTTGWTAPASQTVRRAATTADWVPRTSPHCSPTATGPFPPVPTVS